MPDTIPDLRGIFPIVYTPFDDEGGIDEEDLGRLLDYMIDAGTHGLAAVGGASECHKLTVPERKWLAARTIAFADRRIHRFMASHQRRWAVTGDRSRPAPRHSRTGPPRPQP